MCMQFVFLLITRPAAGCGCPGVRGRGDGRDLDPAPAARRAATAAAVPPEPELGGPALLAALLSVIPQARRHGLRLLVTPDTIVRWHHDIVGHRWAARSMPGRTGRLAGQPPEYQGPGPQAGPGEPRMGLPQDPRRAGRPGSEDSGIDGMGDPDECRKTPRTAPIRADLVAVPARPGPGDPGVRLLGILKRYDAEIDAAFEQARRDDDLTVLVRTVSVLVVRGGCLARPGGTAGLPGAWAAARTGAPHHPRGDPRPVRLLTLYRWDTA